MKVVIQDQTEELEPRLRRYTERRLGKLGRHFEKVLEAEVHFTPESRRGGEMEEAAVKILVHPDGRKKPILKAEARGRDLQRPAGPQAEGPDRPPAPSEAGRQRAGGPGQYGYRGAGTGNNPGEG